MDVGVYNAVRGCLFQQLRFDTIANNLANSATTGFKKNLIYCDQMLQAHQKVTTNAGNMEHTGNPLDVALSGNGFFTISTPEGPQYTRNGRFHLDAAGMLVTSRGDAVIGSGGPIYIEGTDISIDKSGGIQVDGEQVDSLSVVTFDDSVRLIKKGPYYGVDNSETGENIGLGQNEVEQGYLEASNVVVTEEMVRMVEALRNFESYQKVLQTFGEINKKAINEVGRP